VTPLEGRATDEIRAAHRRYRHAMTQLWSRPPGEAAFWVDEASAELLVIESLVYVVTGESRRVRRVPTPTRCEARVGVVLALLNGYSDEK
jgi:hypothetical protein